MDSSQTALINVEDTTQELITNFLKEVFYVAQTYIAGKATKLCNLIHNGESIINGKIQHNFFFF